MLVALGKMRWIAALLVVSVVFTLCGCHASVVEVFLAIGLWAPQLIVYLFTPCGMEWLMTQLLISFAATMPLGTDVHPNGAGNVCHLTASLDTTGDGVGETPLDMQGPWQQDGNRVTATLTPSDVAAAQPLGAPQITLDLRLTGEDRMTGTITYTVGGLDVSGPVTVYRQ